MGMNYRELGVPQQDQYPDGVGQMNELADRLVAEGKLPERFSKRQRGASQPAIEVVRTPLSPETQRLVEHMQRGGYAVHDTLGKTPASLKAEGMRYWILDSGLAERTAPPALLAFKFKASEFFLRGSHKIRHERQLELIPEEQAEVDRRYPGAGLIVREGKIPEWTELALRHFKETGVRIFGRDYGFNATWADDYESDQPGARRAIAGRWVGTDGLHVRFAHPDDVYPRLGLAPLVEIPWKLAA